MGRLFRFNSSSLNHGAVLGQVAANFCAKVFGCSGGGGNAHAVKALLDFWIVQHGGEFGVVVGFDGSLGGEYDRVVGTSAVKAFVLFRGPVGVKDEHANGGLVFDAGVVAARKATMKRLLEGKGIDVKSVAAEVQTSLYGYRSY